MAQSVMGNRFFHVTRVLPYNPHPPLSPGCQLEVGSSANPFFGFYEGAREYPVSTPNGNINCKAIAFLKHVRDGKVNCPELARVAHEVAQHYVMLVRELVMEEVRRQVAPNAPSRQKCLWVIETIEQAKYWQKRLDDKSQIAVVEIQGAIHRADASLLLGDSEPLSVTYDRARKYWLGEMTEQPEPECLVTGKVVVISVE